MQVKLFGIAGTYSMHLLRWERKIAEEMLAWES
jgi:hypothetical protein